jgi:hypothetical protein
VNIVFRQAALALTMLDTKDPRQGAAGKTSPKTGRGGADMTRLMFVVAAAVGLAAVLARSVAPDVTRYLRIRRM